MAEHVIATPSVEAVLNSYGNVGSVSLITSSEAIEVKYSQRVYDTTAGWCYFRSTIITNSPAMFSTTPNHTGNIVAHEVLRTYT